MNTTSKTHSASAEHRLKGREARFIGRVGAELDTEAGCKAARLAALNALAVVRKHLGSLDRVSRVVRIGVSVATSGDVRNQPQVADGASEFSVIPATVRALPLAGSCLSPYLASWLSSRASAATSSAAGSPLRASGAACPAHWAP
jgi:hypothetical protein